MTDMGPPRRRKAVRAALVALILLLGLVVGGVVVVNNAISGYLARMRTLADPFTVIPPSERPPRSGSGQVFLMAGIDTRSNAPTTGANARARAAGRSDALMVVRIGAGGRGVSVVSIPRDSWVQIPGHGFAKINAAYAYGGASLAVRVVERITRMRIDHFALVDFAGFQRLVDAVGGVDVRIDRSSYDAGQGIQWTAGDQRLDGEKALQYVRTRYGLPGGDLDRTARQRDLLKAVLHRAAGSGLTTNPVRLARLLDVVSDTVSFDRSLDADALRNLVLELRKVRAGEITFTGAPTNGTDTIDGQSIVRLDARKGRDFWRAVGDDELGAYLRN